MKWNFYFRYAEVITLRYLLVAGIFFLAYYVLLKEKIFFKKIQQRLPKNKDYRREIGYSITTSLIFAFVPLFILHYPAITKHTTYYTNIDTYGWVYFFLAFPLMIFIHDTYFYWTHRLMHHKKLFRLFHLVHHRSTNPSPWTAYAFHPLEAIVEAGVFVVFLFTIPVHTIQLFVFFLFMIIYNVYGHLGYELYPSWFNRHPIGKWVNTSVSHNQHHQYFTGNYGLYFTFWDRVMGTLRSDYDQQYATITTKKKIQ